MTNFATTNPFAKPFFQSDLREREREMAAKQRKAKDVLGDSQKRYFSRGQRQENPDRAENQSDFRPHYRNLWEKINTRNRAGITDANTRHTSLRNLRTSAKTNTKSKCNSRKNDNLRNDSCQLSGPYVSSNFEIVCGDESTKAFNFLRKESVCWLVCQLWKLPPRNRILSLISTTINAKGNAMVSFKMTLKLTSL